MKEGIYVVDSNLSSSDKIKSTQLFLISCEWVQRIIIFQNLNEKYLV